MSLPARAIAKKGTQPLRSIKTKFILLLLAVSILPLMGVGWFTYAVSKRLLQTQVSNQLITIRNLKAEQFEIFFTETEEDIRLIVKLPTIIRAIQTFSNSDSQAAHIPTADTDGVFSPIFQEILDTEGYDNLFLLSSTGAIVYQHHPNQAAVDALSMLKTEWLTAFQASYNPIIAPQLIMSSDADNQIYSFCLLFIFHSKSNHMPLFKEITK